MKTSRSFKQRIVAAVMAIVMLASSLIGTTFAWFTDSVTSDSNVIQTGRLNAQMHWSDELLSYDSDEWNDAEDDTPVFNYNKWEPGYTEVKYVKVSNAGNLNFKWKLSIEANGTVSILGDVIDVYYVNPVSTELESLDGLTSVGKIAEVVANKTATSGELTPGGNQILAIAFHMDELAGNEYQDTALCDGGFSLKLLATQATGEFDSFGDDYDAGVTFPDFRPVEGVTGSVTTHNNVVTEKATISGTNAEAVIPEGVLVNDGVGELTFSVTQKDKSESNVTTDDGEELKALDVHVEGVSSNNTKPIIVTIDKAMAVGFNVGNYNLYHVENGVATQMTRVDSIAELDAHNEYYYDPATGDIKLAMATFSEVALVADTENAWEGNFDYTWYDASKTELTIANADQLAAFGAIVGGMKKVTGRVDNKYTYSDEVIQDSFSGKTVKLLADINLGDKESENNPDLIFYPIGYWNNEGTYERKPVEERTTAVSSGLYTFNGIFDGNGHIVSNFYQNTWEMKGDHDWYDTVKEQYYRDGMGLFGRVYGGTIKNLTVKNFSSDGEIATTGVIAAYADGATFENIAITNCNPRVYNIGNGGIVGCVGWYAKEADLKTTFKNITVDNSNKISALWGSYDVACGGIVGQYYPTSGQSSADYPVNGGVHFDNCHISAQMDVYNDVCGNYQYYAYRYTGMLIGSVRENVTIDGHSYPKMDGITAENCTVHFGTWNDYYYCEFEKNGHPSYSGPDDYKFSRVPHSELKFADSNGNGIIDTEGERASVTGCKHEHTAAENNQAIYLPFNNLVTGYGWGVTTKVVGELEGVTILDRVVADSVVKFNGKVDKIANNVAIKLGDIFTFVDNGVKLVPSALTVSVVNKDKNNPVSATIDYNRENWENGTITFTGAGEITITIQDYYFCTPTTITVMIEACEHSYDNDCDAICNKCGAGREVGEHVYDNDCDTDCNVCGVTRAVGEHTPNDAVKEYEKAPTCTEAGSYDEVVYCKDCHAELARETITVPAVGHSYNAVVTAPTCTEGGYTTYTCSDCEDTYEADEVAALGHITTKFTGDFLYRVGNQNNVNLGSLFSVGNRNITVNYTTIAGNASVTVNGTSLKFNETGIVKVTLTSDCTCGECVLELTLEVVNATNVVEGGKPSNYNVSSVLLGDTSISTLYLNGGATLYGNGFTIDCTNSPIAGTGNVSENYIIGLAGANLDNVKVIGKVYTEYGAMASSNYNRALIISTGNSTITNCYLSNTAAPVRINSGSLTITGSTLKGGNFANIDVRSGHLTLDNVTTINQALGNDKADDGSTVIGLGIVVYYEMVNTSATSITVKNGLKQYNAISSNDEFSNDYANQFVAGMFNSANSALQYTNGSTKWVNTGIILMTSGISVTGAGNKSDVTFMGATGAVYTVVPTAASIAESPAEYATLGQGVLAPSASLDHDNEAKGNYIPKESGKNDYCYFDGEKVLISMDEGDTFQYDPFILNATKLGNALNYTVKLNGTPVASGSKISFNAAGEHTITYTYEDPYNYRLDSDGKLESFTVTYTKTEIVSVAIVEKAAEHAKFTFATNSTGTEEILYNNNTYISANGVTADGTNWGKITVGDKTIVYPIVTANVNKTASKECQVFYYVFNKVISITDANGTVYSHANGTGTDGKMPSNLKVVKGNELKVENNVFTSYNDSNLTRTGGKIFCYSSSSQEDSPEKFNNSLAFKSPSGLGFSSSSRNYDAAVIVQYQFTDSNNATYYYYVGYKITNPNTKCPSGDGEDKSCVTPDTLITLADGTQVRVDSLTGNEELLVWNMETGKLDKAPIMFVDSEAEAEFEVIKLKFSDGTEVKVISEHGFWDYDLNKYVYLDENAADYIGHTFAKQNGDSLEKVTLVDVVIETELTTAWSPVTVGHLCYFVNGMLSMPGGVGGLFNIFEVDAETMTYDYEQIEKDIETYGLFTYEELNAICPLTEEMFNAAGGAYLKISIGKGNLTLDELIAMINRYSKYI